MPKFSATPIPFGGQVHLTTDVVWERTAKFTDCGKRIPAEARHDERAAPTCLECIRQAKRMEEGS